MKRLRSRSLSPDGPGPRPGAGPRLGPHVSITGGLHHAFDTARSVGCDCMQIFVKNQRQWRAAPLTQTQIDAFRVARKRTGLSPVLAHATYLINLASPHPAGRRRSVRALIDELHRCEALDVVGLVVHPGAHLHATLAAGIRRVAVSLNEVQRACPAYRCRVLLEATAGQGTTIGSRFEQLAAIRERVHAPERVGVCLDTCHLFAAGYDFRSAEGYTAMIAEIEGAIGVASVACIHLNDSKQALGSRVDRHEHIGKGRIGKPGFAHFVNDDRFAGVPMILETPKGKDGRGTDFDRVNLKRLRSLIR